MNRPQADAETPVGREEASQEINLLDYWRILRERRAVVVVTVFLAVVLGALHAFLSIPKYQGKTTLEIQRQGPDILTFEDVVGSDPLGYQDFYQTQYKIMQSRTVLRMAIQRVDLLHRPEYVNRKQPPVKRLVRWTKSTLLGSTSTDDPLDKALQFLEERLRVSPVRASHLVEVSVTDRHPELARDLANAVADAYQQFSLEARYNMTEQASEFLTKEVARLQHEITDLERELQEYGTDRALVALRDGREDISEAALAGLNAGLTEARGRLALAQARFESVRDSADAALPEVTNSPLINHLKQEHAQVERRYGQMAGRFRDDWPGLAELRDELQQATTRLQSEVASLANQVRSGAAAEYEQRLGEVSHLEREVDRQKLEVQRVNRDAIEYASLGAEIATRRKVLDELVARQSETQTSEQLRGTRASNIRVVDRAETPDVPAYPRKTLSLMMAMIMGVGCGVVGAFLLHYVDNTIKNEVDIQRSAGGIPVMGHIPLYEPLRVVYGGQQLPGEEPAAKADAEPNSDLASQQDPRSSFAEAFRNLRTSLMLASADQPPKTLVVTSCEPSDGKSTVSLNLASVLLQMGRKVALIDADLRKPRIAKALGLPNNVGLSNYLSGNAEVGELFQQCAIEGLQVITSGPIPPNPSELLVSNGLEALITRLSNEEGFDHILVDSPPVIQVADSMILSSKLDATILVVRAGKTTREALSTGASRLLTRRANAIGVVLNAVPEGSSYYAYGRYSYRYGYGEEEPKKRGALARLTRAASRQKRAS
ncbi:hypothetical protein ABI59_06145 [Acidobacteria bacterium Mor1]|nr:hypothetical protein ABI59_06145 [Acidobacteria bacterium Mor1]